MAVARPRAHRGRLAPRTVAGGSRVSSRFLRVPLLAVALAPALLQAQTLEVVPDSTRVTVGDPITLRVRVRLPEATTLLSRAAAPEGELPEGFRILSSDSLSRTEQGTLEGRLRVAFFRPGKQSVPPLSVVYAPTPGTPPDTLRSQPVPIEVVAVLPPGDQTLRDIKDLAPLPKHRRLWPWLALAALLLAAGAIVWRRLRRKTAPVCVVAAPPPAALDLRTPYERALERLGEVERARLPERGEVALHYELVTHVLRRYLEESRAAPALELTTAELARVLPPALARGDMRESAVRLLERADLVKFARVRPSAESGERLLREARSLLDRWHAASPFAAPTDASPATSTAAARDGGQGPGAGGMPTPGEVVQVPDPKVPA